MPTDENSLKLGIDAYKSGDKKNARFYLLRAVREEPNNERAWGWLYRTAETDEERIHCLRQALRINPQNESARRVLSDLEKMQKPKGPQTTDLPKAKVATTSTLFSQLTSSNQGKFILGLSSIVIVLLCIIVYLVNKPSPRPPQTTSTRKPVSSNPIGTIRVDSWRFDILEIQSDPGKDSSRQIVVLIGNMYNEGRATDTFTPIYSIVLRDESTAKRVFDPPQIGETLI